MPLAPIDKETANAIKKYASGLQKISGERIWMEMSKILTGNFVSETLRDMDELGVLININLPAPNYNDLNRVIKNTKNPATILASFAKNEHDVNTFAQKWKLSIPERELMRFIVQFRDKPFDEKTAKEMWTDKKLKPEYILELAHYLGKSNIAHMLSNWKTPVFPVTGKDLQDNGVKPGPEMGKILATLNKKWKDSSFELSKDELLSMLNNKIKEEF